MLRLSFSEGDAVAGTQEQRVVLSNISVSNTNVTSANAERYEAVGAVLPKPVGSWAHDSATEIVCARG